MNFENVNLAQATIIDVRSSMEFERGHIKDALNIPLDEIERRIDEIEAIKGEIVFCCLSGNRSGNAVKALTDIGMNNIHNGGGWGILNLQVLDAKSAVGICDTI